MALEWINEPAVRGTLDVLYLVRLDQARETGLRMMSRTMALLCIIPSWTICRFDHRSKPISRSILILPSNRRHRRISHRRQARRCRLRWLCCAGTAGVAAMAVSVIAIVGGGFADEDAGGAARRRRQSCGRIAGIDEAHSSVA